MSSVPQNTPQDKSVYIYTLASPLEPEKIRYVGKTIHPKQRLAQHINDKRSTHRGNWLSSLRVQGLKPVMVIIEETTLDKWKEREVFWVAFYRSQGFNLTNSTEGGDGTELSPEARAKISAAAKRRKREPLSEEQKRKLSEVLRGRKQTPEWVEKRISAAKGRKPSPEAIAKISAAKKGKSLSAEHGAKIAAIQNSPEMKARQAESHRGKKASPETRAKISMANRGREKSPEERAKLAAANRGKKRPHITPNKGKSPSSETRAKISASLTGKKLSPECIEKRSAAIRGRKHSPESIEKMSLARKRWHAMNKLPPSDAPTLWDQDHAV